MHQSGRKRKPVETPLDCEELGELESEIKIEPAEVNFLDSLPLSDPCCVLCKTSSGDKLAVFGKGAKHDPDIVNKIQSCSKLEIFSEANPDVHICRGCLQELDVHYAFQKQALKCNEHAQNRITEARAEFDTPPGEIRVCRFCLKTGKKLLDMHPGGESPAYDLLQKIRECLTIEVNSWDPVTKICRNCITSIDDLLEFRVRHLPASEFIKDEIWHYGPSKLAKRIKQEDEDINIQDQDFEMSVSDSDCSSGKNEPADSAFVGRQKLTALRPELVQLIHAEVDEKNFTVLSTDDTQTKVIFGNHLFRFHSERENGSSLWTCDGSKLRFCKMKLEIDTTGRYATLPAGIGSHSHPPGTAKLMQCPLGKGITEMNGKAEPFYIFNSKESIKRSLTDYTRSLILQGFRYSLHHISIRDTDSVWYCAKRQRAGCKARLTCYGIFHKAEVDSQHSHIELSQHDIKTLLLQTGIDTTSTDAISEFQNVNVEMKTKSSMTSAIRRSEKARVEMTSLVRKKNPEIFQLLMQENVGRNFEVIKIGAPFKVGQVGYEYRYYGELLDKSTIWKCIKDNLRGCRLLTKITPDGKLLEIYEGKHTHGTEAEEIFRYPLGKRMIGEEPLWLLDRFSPYCESRSVVYRDYTFYLKTINLKGEVRWNCSKTHNCQAVLATKGNFQEIFLSKEHSHEKPPKEMVTKLLNGSTTSKVKVNNVSFKQKLLSYPFTKKKIWDAGGNEYDTLYILDVKKGTRSEFIFCRHKYSFASVDQNGTSIWYCLKQICPERGVCCKVAAIVEGLFETIIVAKHHLHEMLPDSILEHLNKQCASLPNSSGENVENLEEIPDHKCPTGNILSILARYDPERNFTMARAKTKLLVNYEGEDYRLMSRSPEGISIWSCVWWEIRQCPISLRMSANGKQVAYFGLQKQHNHADKQIGVFLQAPGKGQIYNEDEDIISSYWLFSYGSEFRSDRGLIYQGYKYKLRGIANNSVSVWRCRYPCTASARVEGTFKTILVKNEHKHARLTNREIKDITGQEAVDTDLLPDCENSNTIVSTSKRLRRSDILRIMSLHDPDRNFQIKIYKEEIKVIHEGYEFVYRSSTPSHTLWRCIYSVIRRCPVILQIDNDCKQAFRRKLPKHKHFEKVPNLYNYPLGESKILDTGTELKKSFWFLMQPRFIRPKLIIIYEEHRYSINFIGEGSKNSKWNCVTAGCHARLTVQGLFALVVVGGSPHMHPPLKQDKKLEMIRLYGTSHENDTKCVL